MNRLKVSFIIPLYNSEDYIFDTLSSILSQSYKNIEVIVVDDGSKDSSRSIVENISDERIFLYSKLNEGACKARNFGFSKSTGDLIQFFDADDLLSYDYVDEKVRIFEEHNLNVIVTSRHYRFVDDVNKCRLLARPLNKDYADGTELILDMASSWKFYQVSSWMISRRLYLRTSGWDEELKRNQDGELFFRLLLECEGVRFSTNPKSFYRLTNNSISSSGGEASLNSFLLSIDSYRDNLFKKEYSKRTRRAISSFYCHLMYSTVSFYPFLNDIIVERIYELGEKKRIGGYVFLNYLIRIIGFNNVVKLVRFLKNVL